ncbi:MAG: hypothetical protein HC797_04235 [Anaerolineales bacterium]|nr:hypothetical protein [Anaerolineales bacterium]
MDFDSLKPLLDQAIASRLTLFDSTHVESYRLFNGFYEGNSSLALDVYGKHY